MNVSGQVGFAAALSGTTDGSDFGWFRSDGASLVAIARGKQTAPGTGGGRFASRGGGNPAAVAIAAGGQVAFTAALEGTPDGRTDNQGLFLGDGQETIKAVVSGQVLPTNLTDSSQGVVKFIILGPNAINSYGQVAYYPIFEFGGAGQYLFTPILHWRNAGSGNWDTDANWTIGLKPAAVHDVVIDTPNSVLVTGPATGKTVKALTVGGGGAPVTLRLGGVNTALKTSALSVDTAGGSRVDVKDSRLIVSGGDLGGIAGLIQKGYHGGAWDGAGIMTSLGSSSRGLGFARAQDVGLVGGSFGDASVAAGDVLIRYTLSGDADLDGRADFNDLVRLAQNYNTTGKFWYEGDFTYDGVVDFNDLVKLAQNYNTALPAGAIAGAPAGFEGDLARAFASVPEPGASLVLVGLAMCRTRRRPFGGR
jgi:hypothetical protein